MSSLNDVEDDSDTTTLLPASASSPKSKKSNNNNNHSNNNEVPLTNIGASNQSSHDHEQHEHQEQNEDNNHTTAAAATTTFISDENMQSVSLLSSPPPPAPPQSTSSTSTSTYTTPSKRKPQLQLQLPHSANEQCLSCGDHDTAIDVDDDDTEDVPLDPHASTPTSTTTPDTIHPCLREFVSKKVDVTTTAGSTGDVRAGLSRRARRNLREYHSKQNELIDDFVHIHEHPNTPLPPHDEDENPLGSLSCIRNSEQAATWSLVVNVILLVIKAIAAGMSGSLAIISTVVESAMDLFSGLVFYIVSKRITRRSPAYPVGKKRFEPLAVIFVASVMGTAALQVILVSVDSMIQGPDMPNIDAVSISLVAAVVVSKTILYLACRVVPTPSAQALAADHINDIVSNITVLCSVLIARHAWVYADCIGAIIVSIFIIVNWSHQGLEQVRNLSGHVAPHELLQRLTWMALHHSNKIMQVDTVRGYGFGHDSLVEIDIVLPADMPLKEAHDIGESLQLRAERLEGVARAFVHLDFEIAHKASDEHHDQYIENSDTHGGHSTTLDYSHIVRHTPE